MHAQALGSNFASNRINLLQSIQGQLIFWFLLLALIPLMVIGGLSYDRAEDALRESIQAGLQAIAGAKAQRAEAWLHEASNDASTGRRK